MMSAKDPIQIQNEFIDATNYLYHHITMNKFKSLRKWNQIKNHIKESSNFNLQTRELDRSRKKILQLTTFNLCLVFPISKFMKSNYYNTFT